MWNLDEPHDERSELFGGRGIVRVWNAIPRPIVPFRNVLACELEPGASVGAHVQTEYAELVIVVSGSGRAFAGERHLELSSGAVIELPLGHTLSLENVSVTEPLRYFIVKAGNDPESSRS
jgi:quercetin dioxygenase-like cupin family protein